MSLFVRWEHTCCLINSAKYSWSTLSMAALKSFLKPWCKTKQKNKKKTKKKTKKQKKRKKNWVNVQKDPLWNFCMVCSKLFSAQLFSVKSRHLCFCRIKQNVVNLQALLILSVIPSFISVVLLSVYNIVLIINRLYKLNLKQKNLDWISIHYLINFWSKHLNSPVD